MYIWILCYKSYLHTIILSMVRYEVKQHKKMFRILTVIAYVICVSTAAIVLSLYYVYLWDPHVTKYHKNTSTTSGTTSANCTAQLRKLQTEPTALLNIKDIQAKIDRLENEKEILVNCTRREKLQLRKRPNGDIEGSGEHTFLRKRFV